MQAFSYLKPGEPPIFKDRFITKISETVTPYKSGMRGDLALIGMPLSRLSISMSKASDAPAAIRRCMGSFTTYSAEKDLDYAGRTIVDYGDIRFSPAAGEVNLERIYTTVGEVLSTDTCPRTVLLGGDHGVTYPSVKAFAGRFGKIGVIQLDAHHDVRNIEDGGRTNGTPFRSLIEEGIIVGEHLVQAGIRDFANGKEYRDYARKRGISVFTMSDIEREGIRSIIERETVRLAKSVDMIYFSLDMDCADQAYAPGCPAAGPGGLTSRELLAAVGACASNEKVKAMDIVEIDPSKDVQDMTSKLAVLAMLAFYYSQ
ncbi:formimidoylglutamase [Bacillus mangrovi]|uniref:Formimidoylglutamase n=1 Tax=Metabacillus mangrovi TaxID=1491830 RepID=A0A7X2S1W6_9BACI|nr:agmatinase family protein [Metabacillus mangrovi]MTH51907.1 formimidoylglutamase [Metabacillus mangrovi]